MVDLAKQAFSTRNYELAAEIYERCVVENGPTSEIYLGLADSYARTGLFSQSLDAYRKAILLGNRRVSSENLNHLVSGLVDYMIKHGDSLPALLAPREKYIDIFSCVFCRGILIEPTTLPCGHSFCRSCVVKDGTKRCKSCATVHNYLNLNTLKPNVVLARAIEKLCYNYVKAAKLRLKANSFVTQGKHVEAIQLYSEALDYAPKDHLIYSNRAHAYIFGENYIESLKDAECAIRLRPDWSKGYYRKAVALSALSRHEEAARAYLQCLAIDSSIKTAKTGLAKEMYKVLSILPQSNPKHAELQLSTSNMSRILESSLSCSVMLTEDTVKQLKTTLRETLLNVEHSSHRLQEDPTSQNNNPLRRCNSFPDASAISDCADTKLFSSTENLGRAAKRTRNGSRKLDSDGTNEAQAVFNTKTMQTIDSELLDKNDLECSLCFRMLFQPVATPCGHVFCRACLDRCLDHNPQCPLCKSALTEYLAERRQSTVEGINSILTTYFPMELEARKKQHEEEIAALAAAGKDEEHEIPVFICTTAFPMVPCPLHIFEPRYRLMIRQCMEAGTRQFGMCLPRNTIENDFADVGTMLEIQNVQFFADGRSIVDCIGGRRFRVKSRGMRDGYSTATVEFLDDVPPQQTDIKEITETLDNVYEIGKEWFNSLGPARQQITSNLGVLPPPLESNQPLPVNGPAWLWWMIAVLPLDPRAQLAILAMVSLKERLKAVKNVLKYLKRRDS